jgi:hypothetical protein
VFLRIEFQFAGKTARVASPKNLTGRGIVASYKNLTPAKHLPFLPTTGNTSLIPWEALSCQGGFPNIGGLTSQASRAHVVSPDGKQRAVCVNDSGDHILIRAPTESPKRFPNRSFPRWCSGSPTVLLAVQRLPPPATAFPTPGAGCSSRATRCQGRAGGRGMWQGRACLALTGVASLQSRTGRHHTPSLTLCLLQLV